MVAHDFQQGDKRAYDSADQDLGHPDNGQEMRDRANKDHEQVSKRQCLMDLDSQPENCHTATSRDPAQPILHHPRPISPNTRQATFLQGNCTEHPFAGKSQSHAEEQALVSQYPVSEQSDTVPPTSPSVYNESSPVTRPTGYGITVPLTSTKDNFDYRDRNLRLNGLTYDISSDKPFPGHVSQLLTEISQARSSPGPSIADLRADEKLRDMAEWIPRFMLDDFYKEHRLFLYSPDYDRIIQRDSRFPMNRGIVPSNSSTMLEVMTPAPDIVYGYSLSSAFSLAQWNKLNTIPGAEVANELCLIFPFLVVEFKGFDESLAVAASECLGSSAACVNSADSLNRYLREVRELNPLCSIADIETCAYSLTMTGWVAVLYVTWKESDGSFKMQRFGTYLLQKPEEFLELRKRLKNILDWGRGARLRQISGLLDWLVQEEQNAQAPTAPSFVVVPDIVMASTPPSSD